MLRLYSTLTLKRSISIMGKIILKHSLETFDSGIGSQTIVVRRANIRFAPTLVSDIGWISITTIYPRIYDRILTFQSPDKFFHHIQGIFKINAQIAKSISI